MQHPVLLCYKILFVSCESPDHLLSDIYHSYINILMTTARGHVQAPEYSLSQASMKLFTVDREHTFQGLMYRPYSVQPCILVQCSWAGMLRGKEHSPALSINWYSQRERAFPCLVHSWREKYSWYSFIAMNTMNMVTNIMVLQSVLVYCTQSMIDEPWNSSWNNPEYPESSSWLVCKPRTPMAMSSRVLLDLSDYSDYWHYSCLHGVLIFKHWLWDWCSQWRAMKFQGGL